MLGCRVEVPNVHNNSIRLRYVPHPTAKISSIFDMMCRLCHLKVAYATE